MAALSDQLLLVTILGYLVAMLLYAAEYTFGQRGVVARVAWRPAERELVGAGVAAEPGVAATVPTGAGTTGVGATTGTGTTGAGATTGTVTTGTGTVTTGTGTGASGAEPVATGGAGTAAGRGERAMGRIGTAAVAVTLLAALTHAGVLLTRGEAAHRVPWGNMYEFVLSVSLVAAVAWLALVLRRPGTRPLGLFVTLVLVALLGLAATVLYTPVGPLVPALNSYWLKIHVSLAATASGVFLVGFCTAALYLIRTAWDRGSRRFPATLGQRLPAADVLERLTFRLHTLAFPIWTLAVICGAIWAEAAWGRYWGWDPKETWAFIAWVVYAGYLHARATPSVRRTATAWIAIAGWAAMLMNLVFVNLFITGLHSYAGV